MRLWKRRPVGGSRLPSLAAKPNEPPLLSAEEVTAFIEQAFPQIDVRNSFVIEEAAHRYAKLRMRYGDHLLRPGGTISGPSMMALADVAMYAAVLSSKGKVALAVTTSFNINFLRKPGQRDMIGEVWLMKLGRRLAVGDIALYSIGEDDLAAHATATYSLPD